MSDIITHRGYKTTLGWYAICCEKEFTGPLGSNEFTDSDDLVTCPAFVFAPVNRDMPEESTGFAGKKNLQDRIAEFNAEPILGRSVEEWALKGLGEDFQKLMTERAERTRLRETRELALKYASLMVDEGAEARHLLAYAEQIESWLLR